MSDPDVQTQAPSAAALAVENERLQRELRARLSEEEALRRVATLVAQQHAAEEVFALVTEEVGRHLDADSAVTVRYEGPGRATVVATWSSPSVRNLPVGKEIVLDAGTAIATVQATIAPARVDSFAGVPGVFAAELRELGLRASVAAPVLVDGGLWGAVVAGSRSDPFPAQAAARYFVAAEALTNAAKYAEATGIEVTIEGNDGWAEITIADDGVGGARTEPGGGLLGLADRVEALGGRLTLVSAAGAGTVVGARLPLATEPPP